MSGFWIAIAIALVGVGAIRTADCALKVPGACEYLAVRYAEKLADATKKDPTP